MTDGIEFVDLGTDDPNVLELKATGTMTADAITKLVERLESIHASGHKARRRDAYADDRSLPLASVARLFENAR